MVWGLFSSVSVTQKLRNWQTAGVQCWTQLCIKIYCSIQLHIINTLKRDEVCLQRSPRLYLGQDAFFVVVVFTTNGSRAVG